jgi:RNA polymerase sigma-70 factor (ECF subfamily)
MELTARQDLLRAAMTHAPELARFFKRRVADERDAQDLMQEVYLALLKTSDSQVIRHANAYLFTIAGNLVQQYWQRAKGRPAHVSLDDLPADVLDAGLAASEANVPECAATLAERLSHLTQRLSELSPKVQAAVVWHHRDGYTCDEIGEKLSVVTHRVKKYLVKGLTHCRAGVAC